MIELNRVYGDDCYNVLRQMDDGCVDLMLQDTPFECTQNDWDIKPDLKKMWPEWLRVAKQNAAFLFFATQPFASELILSQPKLFRYDLIWYKALGTGFLNANRMPMRNHEIILVFYRNLPTYNPQMETGLRKKGNRKHDRTGTNYGRFATEGSSNYFDDEGRRFPQSVLDFSNGDRTTEQDHPTQKPVDLFRYLIRTYSNEGETVFDGYVGSGTTAEASIVEKRNFIVCENKPEYFEMTRKRITRVLSAPTLF